MPRPILNIKSKQENKLSLTNHNSIINKNSLSLEEQEKLLRKKRSTKYISAIHNLDTGGHVNIKQQINEIVNVIAEEFPEIEMPSILIGIISKCYLGESYEVHTLSLAGNIVTHYKKGESINPSTLEKARSLAIWGNYDFIEVYDNCCRAISSDGTVSVIK